MSRRERRKDFLNRKEKQVQRKIKQLKELDDLYWNCPKIIVGWKLIVTLTEKGKEVFGEKLGKFIIHRLTNVPIIKFNGKQKPHPKLIESIIKKHNLTPANVFQARLAEYEIEHLKNNFFTQFGYKWFTDFFKVHRSYHFRYDHYQKGLVRDYLIYHIDRALESKYWKFDTEPLYKRCWNLSSRDGEGEKIRHQLYWEGEAYRYTDMSVRRNKKYRWGRAIDKRKARKEIEDALDN